MSTELENIKEDEKEKDEEKKEEPKMPLRKRILAHWQIGFKVLELILSAACVAFIFDPVQTTGMGKSHLHHVGIMYTAYTGSMVTILSLLIARILKDTVEYKTSFVFSAGSAALFIATGVLFHYDKKELTKNHFFHPLRYLLEMMNTSIALAVINAAVFAADAIVTLLKRQNF